MNQTYSLVNWSNEPDKFIGSLKQWTRLIHWFIKAMNPFSSVIIKSWSLSYDMPSLQLTTITYIININLVSFNIMCSATTHSVVPQELVFKLWQFNVQRNSQLQYSIMGLIANITKDISSNVLTNLLSITTVYNYFIREGSVGVNIHP